MRLFIVGHPSEYGGAGSELRHQIRLWRMSFPEIELRIIPTGGNPKSEPLYEEMLALGISYESPRDYNNIIDEDAVINFCSAEFLEDLPQISKRTKRVMWVNCMTWPFEVEKNICSMGYISHYLYQRQGAMESIVGHLKIRGMVGEARLFKPYFDASMLEYSVKNQDKTVIGRISRQDADKFATNTLHIYEYIVSPKQKQGIFLGFDARSEAKIGTPYPWITTYQNQNQFSVKDFYNSVDFIVQPTDTTENWPRIGLEAMYSGKPLVVNRLGGWETMIEHGVSGFLCNHERDFIYYGSRLAYDDELRAMTAANARQKALEHSSLEVSTDTWKPIFEEVFNL